MRHGNNSRRHHRGGRSGGGHGGGHGGGGHGNHNSGSGGNNGGRRFNPRIQNFDSNGPDVRIRGNAFQVNEKYLSLARDAAAAGDRVLAESYFQHAEHYQRMLNEAAVEFGDHQPQQGFNNNPNGNGGQVDMALSEQPDVGVSPMNGQEEIPGSQPQPAVDAQGGQPAVESGERRNLRHQRPQGPRRSSTGPAAQPATDGPPPEAEIA